MEYTIGERLKHAWNALTNTPKEHSYDYGRVSYVRPDRAISYMTYDKSIITTILNRMSLDVASMDIYHVRKNENDRFEEVLDSSLNYCLTKEANIDQTGRKLLQDIVMSMFTEGVVAVVPVDTTLNPNNTGSYDIKSMRTGKVIEWMPSHVKVKLYNDRNGEHEEVILPKKIVAIIENPLYAIMNEPNSTLKRLTSKLRLLDLVDEANSSGKLDLIIQLPYKIKTTTRQEKAESRRSDIEMQLTGSKYGIAYIDGTEKITQLNRPVDNNLFKQVEYLTRMLYSQLGLTENVFNGTASEEEMLNYYSRTIEPILKDIVEEMERKFLTKTARTQKQGIMFFRDSFKLVPISSLADIADKFTRNEILSSNELRGIIGYKPVKDPSADELRNKNLNIPNGAEVKNLKNEDGGENQNGNAEV